MPPAAELRLVGIRTLLLWGTRSVEEKQLPTIVRIPSFQNSRFRSRRPRRPRQAVIDRLKREYWRLSSEGF